MDVKKGVYMAFEKFTQTGKSYRPKISIRSNGQIGFNFGCIEKFSLEKYKYAVLYFEKGTKTIGIKPTNQEEEGICKLQIRSKNAAISAKAFLDYFDIDYRVKKSQRYEARWNEQERMITATVE